MSRTKARKMFSIEDHVRATEGVECRKDAGVIDETPMAYKDIDDVMAAQSDLLDVVHRLKQVLCVKGWYSGSETGENYNVWSTVNSKTVNFVVTRKVQSK